MWPNQKLGINFNKMFIASPPLSQPLKPDMLPPSYMFHHQRPVRVIPAHNRASGEFQATQPRRSHVSNDNLQNPKSEDTAIKEDIANSFLQFEEKMFAEVNTIIKQFRKTESIVINSIGLDADRKDPTKVETKFQRNPSEFSNFRKSISSNLSEIYKQQRTLLDDLTSGLSEIKNIIKLNLSLDENANKIDSTVERLMPKFDDTFKNHPTLFLRHFDAFIESMSLSPSLQRLYFINAVSSKDPDWISQLPDCDNYEALKQLFIRLTWSKKIRNRVFKEFEQSSFKDLTPQQIGIETKKWCSIIQDIDDADFKHFRSSLIEKLPRHWQTTFRVFASNDFHSLIEVINLCLENESSSASPVQHLAKK